MPADKKGRQKMVMQHGNCFVMFKLKLGVERFLFSFG